MNSRQRLGGLAAFAVVLAAGGWFWFRPAPGGVAQTQTTGTKGNPGDAVRAPLAIHYEPDTTYTYAFRYSNKTKTIPLVGVAGASLEGDVGQPIEGELAVEGVLSIHAFPEPADGEGMALGFSLAECAGHFRVAAQDAWPKGTGCRETMDGRELVVRMDSRGEVLAVYTPEGGASLFDYTMRAIVEETQVRVSNVPGLGSWVEAEPLPQGTVASVYRIAAAEGAATLERTRARYLNLSAATLLDAAEVKQDVAARHQIVITNRVVSAIEGKETLRATAQDKVFLDASTDLMLRSKDQRKEARPMPDLARLRKRGLTDVPESRSLRDRMLEQRAAGLSWEDAINSLEVHGEAGTLPDHNRFLWRATALLELVPGRADDLAALFTSSRAGGRRRGLLLDLLVGAGTPDAQRVLRKLLGSEQAQGDPKYAHLLQRMGFIEEPTKESLGFVKAAYDTAKKEKKNNERFAAAYALGSMADHARDGDAKAAQEIVDSLTSDLRFAQPEELVFLLNALANADSALSVGTFGKYATHGDPEVREAVAGALDDPQTPEALQLLLDLAADPSREVQRAALHSLRRYTLTASVLLQLARIAADGRFAPSNVRFVADLVKSYRFVFPKEEEVLLRALLAGEIDDVLVRAAIQQLLDAT